MCFLKILTSRLRAGNDAAERALQDMMGGKLEKKVEVLSVESEIQRPKWMLGNPKGFSKEQHKEVKEFDLMLKVPFHLNLTIEHIFEK